MSGLTFPESFEKKKHSVIFGATQWTYSENGAVVISVVGGGIGLYGDGINTFEMYDFRQEQPQGYLSIEEINEYLKSIIS
jgi:hypothetical protein